MCTRVILNLSQKNTQQTFSNIPFFSIFHDELIILRNYLNFFSFRRSNPSTQLGYGTTTANTVNNIDTV